MSPIVEPVSPRMHNKNEEPNCVLPSIRKNLLSPAKNRNFALVIKTEYSVIVAV